MTGLDSRPVRPRVSASDAVLVMKMGGCEIPRMTVERLIYEIGLVRDEDGEG